MRLLAPQSSLSFIQELGRDVIRQAQASDSLGKWQKNHGHVRLNGEELYGDHDEAHLVGTPLVLKLDKIL